MSLVVVYTDERNNTARVECDKYKEGEEGLRLINLNPTKQAGYIPYEHLVRVVPTDPEES